MVATTPATTPALSAPPPASAVGRQNFAQLCTTYNTTYSAPEVSMPCLPTQTCFKIKL